MVQLFSPSCTGLASGELYVNPFAWQFLFEIGAWYSCRCSPRLRTLLSFAIAYLASSLLMAKKGCNNQRGLLCLVAARYLCYCKRLKIPGTIAKGQL